MAGRPRRNPRGSSSLGASPAPAYPQPGALNAYPGLVQPVAPAPQPLGSTSAPIPPFTPLSRAQAKCTTYPSRLRAGTTALVQPLPPDQRGEPGFADGATPGGRPRRGDTRRRAAAGIVNYGEGNSDDDWLFESSDDGGTGRGGKGTPNVDETPAPEEEEERCYLGLPAPGNQVFLKEAQKTRHVYFPDYDLTRYAGNREVLVPIRIEFNTDSLRIRDVFMWNVNEKLISPSAFARIFCADLDIPQTPYAEQIEASIRDQLQRYSSVAEMQLTTAGGAREDEGWDHGLQRTWEEIWADEEWKTKVGQSGNQALDVERVDVRIEEANGGHEEDDLRVYVDLDLQIQNYHLRDRIEWDLTSPLTPEAFAALLCRDLGLSGESLPLIAHALHDELLRHKRTALEIGVLGQDGTGASAGTGWGGQEGKGAERLRGVWREWTRQTEFGPSLEVLSEEELIKRERDRDRDGRRNRRAQRLR